MEHHDEPRVYKGEVNDGEESLDQRINVKERLETLELFHSTVIQKLVRFSFKGMSNGDSSFANRTLTLSLVCHCPHVALAVWAVNWQTTKLILNR